MMSIPATAGDLEELLGDVDGLTIERILELARRSTRSQRR
jgi:hypothetical protein